MLIKAKDYQTQLTALQELEAVETNPRLVVEFRAHIRDLKAKLGLL